MRTLVASGGIVEKKSEFVVLCLAVSICVLAGVLIVQVVILVRNVSSNDETSGVVNGEYATAITSCGFVKGLVQNDSYAFLGLQYAIAPLGMRRWAKSELHHKLSHCWNGTYSATERKRSCWQFYRNGSYDGSEDCLYLDVYTSKMNYQNPLDVIVFVGGENLNGGENSELQPSARLARERNVVFVSVSIRRAVLGFLSLEVLAKRVRSKSSGNYGISDLFTALLWVRYNIQHFGGNAESITLLGHQSGSTLLGTLLRNGYHSNLFHRIWMSGGYFLEPASLKKADEENLKMLEYSDCETLQCLLNLSPEELMENVPYDWKQFYHDISSPPQQPEHSWLVYDGEILSNPHDMLSKTNKNKGKVVSRRVPVVIGSPQHVDASPEMRSFLNWNSTEEYRKYLEAGFETLFAIQVYHHYFHPDLNHWQQFSSLLSDYKTICPLMSMSFQYFPQNVVFGYVTTFKQKTSFGQLAEVGSDIKEIFGLTFPRSYKDTKFHENVANLFYTFVKTGSVPTTLRGSSGGKFISRIFLVDDRISEVEYLSNCDLWGRYKEYQKSSSQMQIMMPQQPDMNATDFEFTLVQDSSIETNLTIS